MTITSTHKDIALNYAARDWHVIPLHTPRSDGTCSCQKPDCDSIGKHPRYDRTILPNGLKSASADPLVITNWWTAWPDANIGIVTGAQSGLWVLDIDAHHGGDIELEALIQQYGLLPDTVIANTGGGGQHYLFVHTGQTIKNRAHIAPGIDVRGDGGYIVAPPSLHQSGVFYDWQISPDDLVLATAPDWLLNLVLRPAATGPQSTAPTNGTHGQLPRRTLQYLFSGAPHGMRNDELYAAAQQFKAAGYSQAEAETKLWPRAQQDGLSDHEIKRTIDSAYQSIYVSGPAQKPPQSAQSTPHQSQQSSTKNTTSQTQSSQTSQNKSGNKAQHSAFIARTLQTLGYQFRMNLCTDTIEVNDQPITDTIAAQIRIDARDAGLRPICAVEDTYLVEAANNAYHPIRDYLNGLQWDGQPHIALLASMITCSDPAVTYDDGTQRTLIYVYLRRWLIGAVAKALDGHQNMMIVLAGGQGIGKSHLAAWLCSGLSQYFIEAPISVGDRDTDVRLMSHFIWEVSELDATTRKADVAALKAFITKQTVAVRKAYGRHDTVKSALASFIGTVNEGSGFLTDETGNRRFLVATVESIDWRYQQLDINQVWAEAVAAYRTGDAWHLTGPEREVQAQQNRGHEVESILESWLERYFDITHNDGDRLTTAEIIDHLRTKHDIRLSGSDRAQSMELSRTLIRLGVTKVRTMYWRGYAGIAPKYP